MGNSCGLTWRGLALEVISRFGKIHQTVGPPSVNTGRIGLLYAEMFFVPLVQFSASSALKNKPPSPMTPAIYSSVGVAGKAIAVLDDNV